MIVSNGDILWSASDLTRAAECEFALLRQLDVKLGRIPAAKTAVDPLMDRIAEIAAMFDDVEYDTSLAGYTGHLERATTDRAFESWLA